MHRPLQDSDFLSCDSLGRVGSRIELLAEVDSTNAYLARRAAELPDGAAVFAEYQSAGRGRLGRAWLAPRGSSVLCSVLLFEPVAAVDGGGLLAPHATMLATVAACEAIETVSDCRPGVRWPNDVVIAGRKLGGVLAEVIAPKAAEADRSRAVIIGIGINCLQHPGHFEPELTQRATSLEIESRLPVARAGIAAALLTRLDAWVRALQARAAAVARLRQEWRCRSADLGARVALQHDATVFTGTVVDICDTGDLDVQLDFGGRRRFAAKTTTRSW